MAKVEARSGFAEQLVALAEELRGRADLAGVELRLGRRGAKVWFGHAAKVGLALPEGMTAAYEAHDGVVFGWQERGTREPMGAAPFVHGRLNLLPLGEGFFKPWALPLGFTGAPAEPEQAWMWEVVSALRGVDVPELDQVTRVVGYEQRSTLKTKGKVAPPRLWYFDTKGPKYPLDLDFEGYLREALALVAVAGWQAVFADVERLPESERGRLWVIAEGAERAIAAVERLFPGRVRKEHLERVERLRARV